MNITVEHIKKWLNKYVSDKKPTPNDIVLSTIHGVKGMEADRVWLYKPSLIPHKLAETEAELKEEDNLMYVAITRAKKELYFVEN